MSNLNSHIKRDKVKWIVTLLVGLALVAAVIGLSVQLSRQATTTLGSGAYTIGILNEETGESSGVNTAIYTRKGVTVEGLRIKLVEGAEIEYQLFFFDKNDKFIEATEMLSEDFNGEIPENAVTVRIMIVPTADEDGKVSLTEVSGYANQLKVTVDK